MSVLHKREIWQKPWEVFVIFYPNSLRLGAGRGSSMWNGKTSVGNAGPQVKNRKSTLWRRVLIRVCYYFTWFLYLSFLASNGKVPNSKTHSEEVLKKRLEGLPRWRSGWESACQCRGRGFMPRSGKIPHAAERLGPWATIAEPAHLEPVLRNKRGRDSERPAHRDEEWPPLAATRESPRTETKTQHSQK